MTSVNQFAAILDKLSTSEIVDRFNQAVAKIPGCEVKPVKRFSTRGVAISRTSELLKQVEELEKEAAKAGPPPVVATPKTATEVATKVDRRKGTNLSPSETAPKSCLVGTKQAILVDQLSRPEGVSMEELLHALSGGNKPWTEATVRSGFGWDVKLKGYGVRSELIEEVERFFLVAPKGVAPHRLRATIKAVQINPVE